MSVNVASLAFETVAAPEWINLAQSASPAIVGYWKLAPFCCSGPKDNSPPAMSHNCDERHPFDLGIVCLGRLPHHSRLARAVEGAGQRYSC